MLAVQVAVTLPLHWSFLVMVIVPDADVVELNVPFIVVVVIALSFVSEKLLPVIGMALVGPLSIRVFTLQPPCSSVLSHM